MSAQPAIHVREVGAGQMVARCMYDPEGPTYEIATTNFLTAARTYLARRWPERAFDKKGWSANATEAIYHFAEVPA